jgi:hypothetical protein
LTALRQRLLPPVRAYTLLMIDRLMQEQFLIEASAVATCKAVIAKSKATKQSKLDCFTSLTTTTVTPRNDCDAAGDKPARLRRMSPPSATRRANKRPKPEPVSGA